jgi:hypothetical protein
MSLWRAIGMVPSGPKAVQLVSMESSGNSKGLVGMGFPGFTQGSTELCTPVNQETWTPVSRPLPARGAASRLNL